MDGARRGISLLAPWLAALLFGAVACLPDNPDPQDGGEGDGGGTEGAWMDCGESDCAIVVVSQTLDDRLEVFEVPDDPDAAPRWRGTLGLDFKPNEGGDISGLALDEPLGLTVASGTLHVLVGHYPSREAGSLLSIDRRGAMSFASGASLETQSWWRGGDPIDGFSLLPLEVREPVSVMELAPGRSLVIAFNNDLFQPESAWEGRTRLLVVDETGAVGQIDLAATLGGRCLGGWGLTRIDADTVAVACDGDEGVAVLDVSRAADPALDVTDAAATVDGCFADIAFTERRVRRVAPDGEGGVVVAESPALPTGEDARLWRFDADCNLVSLGVLPGPEIWDLRDLVHLPGSVPSRWLVARGRSPDRGVVVLAEGDAGIEPCRTLPGLDALWSEGPQVIDPVSLATRSDGRAFAVAAGPTDYDNAGPGYGVIAWVELQGEDACDGPLRWRELSSAAPPVRAELPETWRRGPNALTVYEPDGPRGGGSGEGR